MTRFPQPVELDAVLDTTFEPVADVVLHKAKDLEAIDRQQQKAAEFEAAEAQRLAELCQRQMLQEQEAIQKRNAVFLKDSEDRKHALARTKESKRKRALMGPFSP